MTAAIARKVEIPKTTLVRWVNGDAACVRTADVGRLEKQAEEAIDAMCERVARKGLEYVLRWHEGEPAPDPRMLSAVMTSVGIALDKMRLLRDQSTSHVTFESIARAVEADGFTIDEWIAEVNRIAADGDASD